MIRKGEMELVTGDVVVDQLEPGDVFGFTSVMAGQPADDDRPRGRRHALSYLVPADVVRACSSRGRRWRRSGRSRGSASALPTRWRVGPRGPIRASRGSAPSSAARSCATEPEHDGRRGGDGDAGRSGCRACCCSTATRRRSSPTATCGARSWPSEAPSTARRSRSPRPRSAGRPPRCRPARRSCEMLAHGIHHLPVDDAGRIVGVVTDTDLMGLDGRESRSRSAARSTGRARHRRRRRGGARLPGRGRRSRGGGHGPDRRVPDRVDHRRCRHGPARPPGAATSSATPPCSFAWIALGSAARHERASTPIRITRSRSDRGSAPSADDAYFAALAERVTAGLEAIGFPRCHGDAMAIHSAMRAPLAAWQSSGSGRGSHSPTPTG